MIPRFRLSGFLLALFCLTLVAETQTTEAQAGGKRLRPITKLSYDPDAEKVELFQGIEDGKFDVKIIPKDEMGGKANIHNLTDKPLTVQLPKAMVGVQVLKQFGCGGGLGGCGGLGGIGCGGGGGGGQNQPVGGGFGGGLGGGLGGIGGGGIGGGGGGAGFFSVPPKKIVQVPYTSVCLEHGKPDPHPRNNYRLVPVDEFTEDPALQELIQLVGTGKINKQAAQAATWHIANGMSWRELASKSVRLIGRRDVPYFSRRELFGAKQLVTLAQARAKEREKKEETKSPGNEPETSEPIRPRVPRTRQNR